MMKLSLRSFITTVLLFAIAALSIFTALFTIDINRSIPEEFARTAFPTLHTVQILLDQDLRVAEQFIHSTAHSSASMNLGSSSDFTGYYIASEEFHAEYSPLLSANSSIAAVFVVDTSNQVSHTVYGSLSGSTGVERVAEKEGIRQGVAQLVSSGSVQTEGWHQIPIAGTMILYRAVYWAGRYTICLIDLNAAVDYYSSLYGIPGTLVLAREGQILTRYDSDDGEILYDPGLARYTLPPSSRENLLIQDQNSVLDMLCLLPIGELSGNATLLQWMTIGIAILLLAVFLSAYIYLKQNFVRPMSGLMTAMERIRSGDLDALPQAEYASQEFSALYATFQKMIADLKQMKIHAYEQDLENQRIRINSLRLQIRPHFYLNCLKAIYASAAMGNFDHVQSRIMLLSSHLRYCFTLRGDSVPLREELAQCKNYLDMFSIGQPGFSELHLDIEDALLDFQIPPMTILTAVENSAKYFQCGSHPSDSLHVHISARILRMDEERIVNICIQDNGPGFSPEALELIRHPNVDHVGISNIVQQLKFFFGPACEVAFINQDGAQIDIFIPLAKEDGHESADC